MKLCLHANGSKLHSTEPRNTVWHTNWVKKGWGTLYFFFIQAHAKSYWLASSSIRYKKRTSRYWSNSPIGYDAILKEYEKGHIFYSRVLIFDVNSKCNLALIKISDTDYQAKQKKKKKKNTIQVQRRYKFYGLFLFVLNRSREIPWNWKNISNHWNAKMIIMLSRRKRGVPLPPASWVPQLYVRMRAKNPVFSFGLSQSKMVVNALLLLFPPLPPPWILRSLYCPLAVCVILWHYYWFSLYSCVSFLQFKMWKNSYSFC